MNKKIDKVIGILKNKYVHNGTLSEKRFVDIASKYDISILDMIRIQELLYEDGIDIKTSDNDSENDKIPPATKGRQKSQNSAKEKAKKSSQTKPKTQDVETNKLKENFFKDYQKSRIQSTYMPVFVLAFLETTDNNGFSSFNSIANYYKEYYEQRKNNNLVVERNDSIFAYKNPTIDEIKKLILFNPLGRSMLKNYFSYDKKSDTVSINQVLWHILNTADILRLRDISQHLLETYYEKHKKGEISQITSNTSRVNISSIPYSGFFMFYICGYYYNGVPLFTAIDSFVNIQNNCIEYLSVSTELYEKLKNTDELTLSPVLSFKRKETESYSLGISECISPPTEGKGYRDFKAQTINAPYLECSPLVFECRITDRQKKHITTNLVDTNISAEIVNISVINSAVENGEINFSTIFGLKEFINLKNQKS